MNERRMIVFTALADETSALAWRRSIDCILTGVDEHRENDGAPAPVGRVIWRLLSTRRLELAVSADDFDDLESARSHALEVLANAPDLVVEKVAGPRRLNFSWYLSLKGSPVIAARRWYPSYQGRNQSARLVSSSIGEAVVAKTLDERIAGYLVRSFAVHGVRHDPPIRELVEKPLIEAPKPRPIRDARSRTLGT